MRIILNTEYIVFVSVCFEVVSPDTKLQIKQALIEYGFKKLHDTHYESFEFLPAQLGGLKKDLALMLDSDDKLRIYQYPLDNCLKISFIEERKWKRLSIST